MSKKFTITILSGFGKTFTVAGAERVHIRRWLKTAIHHSLEPAWPSKRWTVTEMSTGYAIGMGRTKRDAIAAADDRIKIEVSRLGKHGAIDKIAKLAYKAVYLGFRRRRLPLNTRI